VAVGILPAATSNLFATNLGIEQDVEEAVRVALRGDRRKIDVGRFNGERFATMAGAGFDAAMIRAADNLKDRLGRAACVLSGVRTIDTEAFQTKIRVDGTPWYDGPASCILFGNVRNLFGGIEVFNDASLDDGLLDLSVVTAEGPVQLSPYRRAHGSRRSEQVALRTVDEGAQGQGQARPQGPVRARRRRPQHGHQLQGTCRTPRGDHLRPARGVKSKRRVNVLD
jgi:YegS C-terminal NAD kinase beta sandwich-like domain/Diacylglycerol kinase catalytic domain